MVHLILTWQLWDDAGLIKSLQEKKWLDLPWLGQIGHCLTACRTVCTMPGIEIRNKLQCNTIIVRRQILDTSLPLLFLASSITISPQNCVAAALKPRFKIININLIPRTANNFTTKTAVFFNWDI